MSLVILPAALRLRVDVPAHLELNGPTAGQVLHALESHYPSLRGWVLDEQGRLREHVKVFVNGREAQLETNTNARDEVYVMPAISGG